MIALTICNERGFSYILSQASEVRSPLEPPMANKNKTQRFDYETSQFGNTLSKSKIKSHFTVKVIVNETNFSFQQIMMKIKRGYLGPGERIL